MQGFIYVVGFESGVVKVGRTRNPKRRISAYRKDGAVYENAVTATWISPPHLRSRDNEANLIRFCINQGAHIDARRRGEYFTGVHFEDARTYAESLDFTHPDPDRWDLMAANGGSLPVEEPTMTSTPKPITLRTKTADRSPIGSRYTLNGFTYTLVAYSHDRNGLGNPTATPVLVADDDLDAPRTEFDILSDGSLPLEYPHSLLNEPGDTLEPAPEDAELAARARAAAKARYDEPARSTGDQWAVLSFEDLKTGAEFEAFTAFVEAELGLRKAQAELDRASRARSATIARIADLRGSQASAAQLLGMNQSTVSRALRERPELP